MKTIIVTDLTRFGEGKETVCTAGIDIANGQCIRPMPYLTIAKCTELKILPGAILRGDFYKAGNLAGPHQEDMQYSNSKLEFIGPCESLEFKSALETGLFDSVAKGFELELQERQKYIPIDHPVKRSIITIAVNPREINIVDDTYKPGKIKVHFTDHSGHYFPFMPITDYGFHRFAEDCYKNNAMHNLNSFIRSQNQVYLRIGLSRRYSNGSIEGYWLQVNKDVSEAITSYLYLYESIPTRQTGSQ